MIRAWWRWARKHASTLLVVVPGFVLILVGLVSERDSLGRICVGTGLLLAGATPRRPGPGGAALCRNRTGTARGEPTVGPGGAEVELHQRTRESTTQLAVEAAAIQAPLDIPEPEQVVDVHRLALANDIVSFLTHPQQGPLQGCAFQLYLFDSDEQMLLPVLQPSHVGPSPGFRVGEGVAGKAWETGEFTMAEGAAAHDDTFSLDADKQSRYSDLAVVAAAPVTNAVGSVVAVVSASSTDPDSGLRTPEGFEALVALADRIARVLIDVLKWFDDDYDVKS